MSKPLSQRQRKVGEHLRHVITDALLRGPTPNVRVSEVLPAPDLRTARVFVCLPEGDAAAALGALAAQAPALQREINRRTHMKFTPRLTFAQDKSAAHAQRISDILAELPKDDRTKESS